MITPFASFHLRSRTDELPEYFVPEPPRDILLFEPTPALPPPPTINRNVLDARLISPEQVKNVPPPPTDEPLDLSLRRWARSTKTHNTDQNEHCELRYNRHVFCAGKIPPASASPAVWQMRTLPLVPETFPYKPL